MSRGLLLLSLFLLAGCGYQFGHGSLVDDYESISVPYIKGDRHGLFTAAMAKELSTDGHLVYSRSNGQLCMRVEILDLVEDRIGYRYDLESDGTHSERLVPSEGRLTVEAELIVCETASGKRILGPVRFSTSVDFDHDFYTTPDRSPTFSLGQLDDIHVAREVAVTPLADKLAAVVVEYISHAW